MTYNSVESAFVLFYCAGQQLFLTLSLISVSIMCGRYELGIQYCKYLVLNGPKLWHIHIVYVEDLVPISVLLVELVIFFSFVNS